MDPIEHSAIHSRENARFKLIRSLSGSRGVKKHGLSIVAGRRLVAEVLAERAESVELVVHSAGDPVPTGASATGGPVAPAGIPAAVFTPELFRELDFLGAGSPLLMVRVPQIPDWSPGAASEAQSLRGLSVFLPLSDPDNLGAAIRSCVAFGVDRIILLAEAAHPFHPRALRSAAGQTWRAPLLRGPALAGLYSPEAASTGAAATYEALQAADVPLFALDLNGEDVADLDAVQPGGDVALLVGEEGPGIPADLHCRRLRIPIRPGVESLNAGVALGIALYHFRRI